MSQPWRRLFWALTIFSVWAITLGTAAGLGPRKAEVPESERPRWSTKIRSTESSPAPGLSAEANDFLSPDRPASEWPEPYVQPPINDLVPPPYRDLVIEVARQQQLDARLLAAVITLESQWNPRLVSGAKDTGLMQIIPGTAEWIASRLKLKSYDLFDPRTNATMGAWFLRHLIDQYGNWPHALAAYNGGPGAATRGSEYPYTVRVLQLYHPTRTSLLPEGTAAGRQAGPLQ